MQRWIVLGLVLLALLMGGAYYGYKTYHANRPGPIWVPLAIRPDLSKEVRDRMCRQFETFLADDARATAIAAELGLAKEWSLASDEEAGQELQRRIFVKQGSTGPAMGDQPSINIGVNGRQKDKPLTEKIVMRMMKDVQQQIQQPDAASSPLPGGL